MLTWLKSLFNPKALLKTVVDALSLAQVPLAAELDKGKALFNSMTSFEQAGWIITKLQTFLRDKLKLHV